VVGNNLLSNAILSLSRVHNAVLVAVFSYVAFLHMNDLQANFQRSAGAFVACRACCYHVAVAQ